MNTGTKKKGNQENFTGHTHDTMQNDFEWNPNINKIALFIYLQDPSHVKSLNIFSTRFTVVARSQKWQPKIEFFFVNLVTNLHLILMMEIDWTSWTIMIYEQGEFYFEQTIKVNCIKRKYLRGDGIKLTEKKNRTE